VAKVLVVDDDHDVLNLVSFRLRKAQHKVIAVSGAEEALSVVAAHGAPDVAVLDVTMPGTDGLELLRSLRARDGLHDLPAIFLSARVQAADIEAGRALGATYLTKPFVATALLNAIEALLNKSGGELAPEGW